MSCAILIIVYAIGGVGFICTLLLIAALLFGWDAPPEPKETTRTPACAPPRAHPVRRRRDMHPIGLRSAHLKGGA